MFELQGVYKFLKSFRICKIREGGTKPRMKFLFAVVIMLYVTYTDSLHNEEAFSQKRLPGVVSIAVLRVNKHSRAAKPHFQNFKLNKLYNTIVRQGPSLDKYLYTHPLKCNYKRQDVNPKNFLRKHRKEYLKKACQKNCTNNIARECNECIEETVEALAYSCMRKCGLDDEEKEFIHEFDFSTEEQRCKRITSRCCTHNCLRQLGKACYSKMKHSQLCTRETMEILKVSCITRCKTSSSNVYLNTFCSFVHAPYHSQQKRQPFPFFES